ncbi:MFS transporter [Kangiella sp.]|uniref:MFS transporter n=1 Tax=Kangiella sp. TaxID=1920245 RepID=UPI00198A74EB|nr:MFS transporter [Kangiella sp.]MBD3653854.1 MFS transporter [Kangiella sp.]
MTESSKAQANSNEAASTLEAVYQSLTSEDDGRVCKDIPDSACRHQPKNVVTHVISLTSTKVADGLIDPKLILSWLMSALGASSFMIGLLVPIREAGALLPQLFTAGALRQMPQRKWAWAAGSFVQGACAAGMALSALFLEAKTAGWVILILLAILAVARSVCSVSYKDVLGKTVSKSMRGRTTGLAASIAAGAVIAYALLLSSGWLERQSLVIGGLLVAGALWIFASVIFASLAEEKGATEGGGNPLTVARENFSLLAKDKQLIRFISVRGLLIATALAPPFMVTLGGESTRGDSLEQSGMGNLLSGLGPLVLASALASLLSSYVWGHLSDRSSRRVLIYSGLFAALALALTAIFHWQDLLQQSIILPALLFILMIAYHGVRLGRSTHLVDMADADNRAAYTALSNTIIGLLLLAGAVFSVIAEYFGLRAVMVVMTAMCLLSSWIALGLNEVQKEVQSDESD